MSAKHLSFLCSLRPPRLLLAVFESSGQYMWWPVSTRRVWTAWCPAARTAKSFVAPGTRSSGSALGSSPALRSRLPGVLCRRARRPGAPDEDRPDWGWSSDWMRGCHPPPPRSNRRCPFGASVLQPSGCTYRPASFHQRDTDTSIVTFSLICKL